MSNQVGVSISTLYKEVLGYKESKIELENADAILKRIKRYGQAIEKYIASGATDGLELAEDTLKAINDVEDKLFDMKVEKEGPPVIKPEEIKYDAEKDYLGGGAFGSVYKCQCRGKSWAVKVPKRENLTPEKVEEFKTEISVMKKVYHPNVVLFLGASTNPIMIVTELMTGGDLGDLIHKPERYATLTLERKLKIAIGIAAGMNWLHGINNIIHRDLKPANILLDRNGTPKIGDFGFSEILLSEDETTYDEVGPKGTPYYMAPEILQRKALDKSIDVYAFGIILFELMTGRCSFPGYKDFQVFARDVVRGVRPAVEPQDKVPPAVCALMSRCWAAEASARPSFEEVCAQLRAALLEKAISYVEARAFWLENFEDEEAIRFEDLRRLAEKAGVDVRPLEAIFCDDHNGTISMEKFSLLYQWFGPWFKFAEAPGIVEEIKQILGERWFHGFIDKSVMVERLSGCGLGTFLVRLSDTTPGCPFTVSYVAQRGMSTFVNNTRIQRVGVNPSVYKVIGTKFAFLEDARFASLGEVIDSLSGSGVISFPAPKMAKLASYDD